MVDMLDMSDAPLKSPLVCIRSGRGMLLKGLASIVSLLGTDDLPAATCWVLLLALLLLAELRNPQSRYRPYLQLLPSPVASRLKAVCWQGPDATDLLLFSQEELNELQCRPVLVSCLAEKARLTRVYDHVFSPSEGDSEPAISLASFVWAHCLLRQVDLRTRQAYRAGDEVLLSYGARPMRDMLRNYAFIPAGAAMEVYEDLPFPRQALLVLGSAKSPDALLRLVEVRVLANGPTHPLLELSWASVLYTVTDGVRRPADDVAGVRVVIDRQCEPDSSCRRQGLDVESERKIVCSLGGACAELLATCGSSVQEDEELLAGAASPNLRLARQYRLQRKRLLHRVISGLEVQAAMLAPYAGT
ncbi:hypothetical protein WJX72_002266 [[Myrmecia] bisecta]|uniref:Rubisco LSMT substrate-binding domain-containing protein n=1 Tax=[Myrmecia] bisecta TaxID=41462 RepID=A0AAW1QEG3_9CHLO